MALQTRFCVKLYKTAGDDVLQHFDLFVMLMKDKDHDKSCSSLPSNMYNGRRDSLFFGDSSLPCCSQLITFKADISE